MKKCTIRQVAWTSLIFFLLFIFGATIAAVSKTIGSSEEKKIQRQHFGIDFEAVNQMDLFGQYVAVTSILPIVFVTHSIPIMTWQRIVVPLMTWMLDTLEQIRHFLVCFIDLFSRFFIQVVNQCVICAQLIGQWIIDFIVAPIIHCVVKIIQMIYSIVSSIVFMCCQFMGSLIMGITVIFNLVMRSMLVLLEISMKSISQLFTYIQRLFGKE